MTEPEISIGIYTAEDAVLSREGSLHAIRGVVIGKGFHWQDALTCRYEGDIVELPQISSEGIRFINRLPLESYLRSVVGSEMNPGAPLEFLRAHAVISRSWALRKMAGESGLSEGKIFDPPRHILTWEESDAHTLFHLCSDDHCQRYQGVAKDSESTREAVESTRGIVIMEPDGSRIADARFSKCCGGTTARFDTCWAGTRYPFPQEIADPWCDPSLLPADRRKALLASILKPYDLGTPYYRWEEKVSRRLIGANLRQRFGSDIGEVTDLIPLRRDASDRISLIAVEGTAGKTEIGKELAIRRLLSPTHLKSSAFQITGSDSENFILHGKGWGHGVGMCQIGAAVMALHGHTAEEILSFYFPGARLHRLY